MWSNSCQTNSSANKGNNNFTKFLMNGEQRCYTFDKKGNRKDHTNYQAKMLIKCYFEEK